MPRDDRGQALVLILALLGLAALALAALAEADGRLLTRLRARHAAEAAAESAGTIVADRLLELFEESLLTRRDADALAVALSEPILARRAETAARDALAALGADLIRIALERRADEVSVRAEVRLDGVTGIARVGVRPP